jgi:hypothetical protein
LAGRAREDVSASRVPSRRAPPKRVTAGAPPRRTDSGDAPDVPGDFDSGSDDDPPPGPKLSVDRCGVVFVDVVDFGSVVVVAVVVVVVVVVDGVGPSTPPRTPRPTVEPSGAVRRVRGVVVMGDRV